MTRFLDVATNGFVAMAEAMYEIVAFFSAEKWRKKLDDKWWSEYKRRRRACEPEWSD